jgi:lysozyme
MFKKLLLAILSLFKTEEKTEKPIDVVIKEEELPIKFPQDLPPKIPSIALGAHGLDLSHHNEKVDLIKLKSQGFVIIKSTEGKGFLDPKFESRWIGLKAVGVKRGSYHFYRTNVDWKVQADYFLKNLGVLDGNEILALDYETCAIKGLLQSMDDLKKAKPDAIKFMKYVKEKTGITPWFYTYHGVILECNFGEEFTEFPLWYARYTRIYPNPKQGPWKTWEAWQYADNGEVDGVSNDVDMNLFRTSLG